MKKIGIILLMFCLVMGNLGFADDGGGDSNVISLAKNQKVLFNIPIEKLYYLSYFLDFDYNPSEGLIYLITENEVSTEDEFYEGYQFTFELDGDFVEMPRYPEIQEMERMGIEFDGNDVYSIEYDSFTGASYVYDLVEDEELGEYDESGYNGFAAAGNQIAFHRDRQNRDLNFDIGTIDPFVSTDGTVEIVSFDAGRIFAFDFTPSGSEFLYGAFSCYEDGIGAGLRVVSVSPVTGELINEFLVTLPEGVEPDDLDEGSGRYNAIRGIHATEDYIVVFYKLDETGYGYIQRYTYEGKMLESVVTDYCAGFITAGPDDSTLYIQGNRDEDYYFDVMKVKWDVGTKSTGRPKSIISERTVGGVTTAEFKNDGFGLLRAEESETGVVNYRAPLKSDEMKVKLRIPFADLQGKLNAGAENLLIEYQGQQIQIPMSAFDCADLLGGMPCQDDATVEIQLTIDEAGNVKVVVQLFVVEQVDAMTKVVHRKIIQY